MASAPGPNYGGIVMTPHSAGSRYKSHDSCLHHYCCPLSGLTRTPMARTRVTPHQPWAPHTALGWVSLPGVVRNAPPTYHRACWLPARNAHLAPWRPVNNICLCTAQPGGACKSLYSLEPWPPAHHPERAQALSLLCRGKKIDQGFRTCQYLKVHPKITTIKAEIGVRFSMFLNLAREKDL